MAIQVFEAEPIYHAQATLGEGPVWDPRYKAYWWIDIEEKRLFRFDPLARANRQWQLDQMPGAVAVRTSGGIVLAAEHGFFGFDPESGDLEPLGNPESDRPDNRFNDGNCDPAGRFWAGTMRRDDHMTTFTGSLYSMNSDHGIIKRWGDDLGVSNGIAWSLDARYLYLVDSPRREIYRFDYDLETGEITRQTCCFKATEAMGYPDGMAMDAEGFLWVAFWGGACVCRICPKSSRVIAKVSVPVAAPTACAFGGQNLEQLLITTASIDLSPSERKQQPLAGDLFVARVPTPGLARNEFAG